MTDSRADSPVPAPRARWKRRLAVGSIGLTLFIVLIAVGAVLAWQNRTDLLAWGIAAYLKGDDIQDVSMSVVTVERDRIFIRDIKISGAQETTIDALNIAYTINDFIGGTIDSLSITRLKSRGGAVPVDIDMISGDGDFKLTLFNVEKVTAGLDLIRLRLGTQQFDPSRVELGFHDNILVLDTAFTSPDGYVTALGSGPLNTPGTPFRLLLSGRLGAALAVAPVADVIDARGHLTFSVSATINNPLFFLEESATGSIELPEEINVDGNIRFSLDHLSILATDIPTAASDVFRFRVESKFGRDGSAHGRFSVEFDAEKRDTPEFGFAGAEARLAGTYDLDGRDLALALADGPLIKLRDMRLSETLPVPGDMALQLLGGGNKVVVDIDKKTARHAIESQVSWASGELSLTSEGHLTEEKDPTVFTLRGAFDATPLLALSPRTKATSGNANLFLAGHVSQPLILFRSPPKSGGTWPGDIRLDGAAKLKTIGLTIPGSDPSPGASDSIEIVLKGFNGSSGRQGGRLAANGVLDTRKFGGMTVDQVKLALEGRLSFGTRGYHFVPGFESVLNIKSLKTDAGVVIPNGLNFQLTGNDNHVTVPANLSAIYHELTFAHLEADGFQKTKTDERRPFRITIPKVSSRQIENQKLAVYLTGGSFELSADKLTGRGVNASLEATATGFDLGLETGEIRHGARPPLTTPITVSGRGKVKGDNLDATLTARQSYGPLKISASVAQNLATQAGRVEFRLPRTEFGAKKPKLEDIFPPAAGWFVSSRGAASATGHVLWDGGLLSGQMAVELDGVDLATADAQLTEVGGTINFIELFPLSMPPRQRLTGKIASGALGPWPMQLEFQLREDGKVEVQDLDIEMASGVVRTRALVDPATLGTANGSVQLRSVDLRELLELIGVEGLKGTGRITGTVPISVRDGQLGIADGLLKAEGPGVLRYQGTALQEQLAARPDTVGTVAQVLSDFRYKTLTMEISKAPEGTGVIILHMNGQNPEVFDGHPFAFNIKIESDFLKLGRIAQGGLKAVSDVIQQVDRPAPVRE